MHCLVFLFPPKHVRRCNKSFGLEGSRKHSSSAQSSVLCFRKDSQRGFSLFHKSMAQGCSTSAWEESERCEIETNTGTLQKFRRFQAITLKRKQVYDFSPRANCYKYQMRLIKANTVRDSGKNEGISQFLGSSFYDYCYVCLDSAGNHLARPLWRLHFYLRICCCFSSPVSQAILSI